MSKVCELVLDPSGVTVMRHRSRSRDLLRWSEGLARLGSCHNNEDHTSYWGNMLSFCTPPPCASSVIPMLSVPGLRISSEAEAKARSNTKPSGGIRGEM